MGADRLQPGQARRPEPNAPLEGEAAVRIVAATRGGRRPARPCLRANGCVRSRDRASTLGVFALEQRDIDRALGVVYVRRAYANGRLKHTKTRLSTRAVPLQAIALASLDRLPPSQSSLLFPNARGRHIDFRSFGRRHWQTAQVAAGIEPLRHLLRPPPRLRHVRTARRRLGVRGLPLHGLEHRDDRPPLRPPRPRQRRTRRLAPGCPRG
jgi:hypothetical protein